jgi:CRISPR/Cas system CMR-associated protein Cmr3 (group 5 of RAMP superfamily)
LGLSLRLSFSCYVFLFLLLLFFIVGSFGFRQRYQTRGRARNFLYFATPAYFEGGWLPNIPGTLPVKPITAAIHRYQTIGGWALEPGHAGGQSKLARRCIPAGSVYFFDHSIHVTKPVTEYGWQIGYGITLTGEW